jgi:hypothetical protein
MFDIIVTSTTVQELEVDPTVCIPPALFLLREFVGSFTSTSANLISNARRLILCTLKVRQILVTSKRGLSKSTKKEVGTQSCKSQSFRGVFVLTVFSNSEYLLPNDQVRKSV